MEKNPGLLLSMQIPRNRHSPMLMRSQWPVCGISVSILWDLRFQKGMFKDKNKDAENGKNGDSPDNGKPGNGSEIYSKGNRLNRDLIKNSVEDILSDMNFRVTRASGPWTARACFPRLTTIKVRGTTWASEADKMHRAVAVIFMGLLLQAGRQCETDITGVAFL